MTLSQGAHLGPYEILAPLGAGGMGEVYRARDARLDRDVAIKVLPQAVALDAEALARFQRETKALAALSHPNILAIHDVGNQDGVAYAVTELLEGETLRDALAGGAMSQDQALGCARQILQGLSAAHERGVIHRDLKPENLFLSKDGHLKILDFGLAKRDERVEPEKETSAPTASGHTRPGSVMGTVGYMSPEQVRGLAVDQRSDLFSFGAVLYEMLSGTRAFSRPTASDTMAAILRDEPPALSAPAGSVPAPLERVVRHCLEKNRDHRFQTARDITFALGEASGPAPAAPAPPRSPRKGLIFSVAALMVVLAAAAVIVSRRRPETPIASGPKRIAVLPFENIGAAEDDYFADGISDEIRGKLTTLPGIEVIARASSTPYKKTTKTPREIARELDARYLLSATVRWQKTAGGNRVLVSPELVEVKDAGAPASRWQEPFDASLTDVFQVQTDIAARVAKALGVQLATGQQKQLEEKPTQNLAAYDAFLKGQDVWKTLAVGDPPGIRRALEFYEQAVALDPGFAQAWAKISWGNSSLYANAGPAPEFEKRAREAAEKAIALTPDRPEGYHALGNYRRLVHRDASGALAQYERGLRAAPTNADLLTATALAEEVLGRWEAALGHLRQSERLDPRSVPTHLRLGDCLRWLRRYPEARAALDAGLAIAPTNLTLRAARVGVSLAEGDLAGARAVIAAAPPDIPPTDLIAYVATYDLVWILSDEQRALLLRLTPAAFGGDRMRWASSLLQASSLSGDADGVRRYAEELRAAVEGPAAADPQRRAQLGRALADLGRFQDAIREGERAVELEKDNAVELAGVQWDLALVYIRTGDNSKAIETLETLLNKPSPLSPGWLKIDPTFDPLRADPRFQKLVASASTPSS